MNEMIVNELFKKCKNMVNSKKVIELSDFYEETINLVMDSDLNDKNKINLLTELYRYGYYNGVRTSIDPRGDRDVKYSVLKNIQDAVSSNDASMETLNKIKEHMDFIRAHIDSPSKFIEEELNFYKENPNAKF